MAQHASELLEQEQMDRRELQEQNQDVTSTEHELVKRNEELQLQVAELSILARIKQSEEGEESTSNNEAVLEKYWETKRELETLRQKISTEHEDEIERLQHSKKVLEKKLADSEAETDDLRRNLAMTRKKASKFSSELNDLKLLLETQQARNEELEKRQRK
jgi:myosin-18